MFQTKLVLRSSLLKKSLLRNVPVNCVHLRIKELGRLEYHSLHSCQTLKKLNGAKYQDYVSLTTLNREYYSTKLPDASEYSDLELKKIKAIFPEPRMTLNNLSAKTSEKIFDVHYKQYVAPKAVKKKGLQNPDWTCTYNFVWPEKMTFEW